MIKYIYISCIVAALERGGSIVIIGNSNSKGWEVAADNSEGQGVGEALEWERGGTTGHGRNGVNKASYARNDNELDTAGYSRIPE